MGDKAQSYFLVNWGAESSFPCWSWLIQVKNIQTTRVNCVRLRPSPIFHSIHPLYLHALPLFSGTRHFPLLWCHSPHQLCSFFTSRVDTKSNVNLCSEPQVPPLTKSRGIIPAGRYGVAFSTTPAKIGRMFASLRHVPVRHANPCASHLV